MGCVHCEAAGSIASGVALTDEQDALVADTICDAVAMCGAMLIAAVPLDVLLDALVALLHQRCPSGRRCWCQHGMPWEQDEASGAPAYIDALPADDPRRIAYETTIGRKVTT